MRWDGQVFLRLESGDLEAKSIFQQRNYFKVFETCTAVPRQLFSAQQIANY